MPSNLLKLNFRDFLDGLFVAVVVVVLGALQQMVTAHGIDFVAYDWSSILNLALTAGFGYLGKSLVTAQNGKVLGKI